MRWSIAALLVLAGCANEMDAAQTNYNNCLADRPVEYCRNEQARLEAAIATQRVRASVPPPVLQRYSPPPPVPMNTGVNCVRSGNLIQCY